LGAAQSELFFTSDLERRNPFDTPHEIGFFRAGDFDKIETARQCHGQKIEQILPGGQIS
jgi:hypothetical protein